MTARQTHPKMFQKNRQQQIHKTVQSNMLWLNLNKIDEMNLNKIDVFYNQQINLVTPNFTFMRRAQNADARALKQHRLSQK